MYLICYILKDLGDIGSDEVGEMTAISAAAAAHADTEQEAFPPPGPQASALHRGSQCNLRPLHRSSGSVTSLICRSNCICHLRTVFEGKKNQKSFWIMPVGTIPTLSYLLF